MTAAGEPLSDDGFQSPLTVPQRRRAITAVLIIILLGAIDQTIVGVALPTIATQLGGLSLMAWVVSGYLIASTVVTPLYGRFSDLLGRRAVLDFSLLTFLGASVLCALAQTMPQLIAARVLQGAAGGGLLIVAQAVVADIVAPRERARYQSYISMVWAFASVFGPVAGGVLTGWLSWPWIFWINLPIGLAALWLTGRALRALPVPRQRPVIDWWGMVLLVLGLTALLVPIARVGQGQAWTSGANATALVVAVLVLAVFCRHQLRTPHPVLPLALLGQRTVLLGNGGMFVCFFLYVALSVLVPLRLQWVGGLSLGQTALHILPLTLGIPIGAFAAGRRVARTGRVRPPLWLGVGVVPAGLLALAWLPVEQAPASSLAMLLLGAGMGLQMPTALLMLQQAVAPHLIGTVTALTGFFRLLGGAVGVAVLGSVTLNLLREHLPPPLLAHGLEGLASLSGAGPAQPLGQAIDPAFRQALLWATALSLAGPLLALGLPDTRLHDGGRHAAPEPA
ncbi:MDR family MFS transporter [Aquabacterium sp. J223]|uniref:MDR family MFS transporter n=1 Tax=Aquabacterium sp. J223 TaxID=2898431 RepID=UPI0021AE09F5|nr:MDR family MFS transporter [Aquabacterium sp. J223]UUX95133.1 MFS transporter [Aquabacterium sp. J223]